jgi:predicted DNA-binding transcriptional regulator YafY
MGFQIVYTNYRGDINERRIHPLKLYWGSNEYHPKEQWLVSAMDLDRNVIREFALNDISESTPNIHDIRNWSPPPQDQVVPKDEVKSEPLTKEDFIKIAKSFGDNQTVDKINSDPTYQPWICK